MNREAIRITLVQLVELHPRPPHEFFTDWRCRLCDHLKWAVRTPGVRREEIQDLCGMLGLDVVASTIYGRQKRREKRHAIRNEAVTLVDHALQECLTEFCHPNEFGGYDTDSREAAGIAVDTLVASGDLLAEMARLQ